MAVAFHEICCPPVETFTASALDGVVIGIVGEDGSGGRELLRVAAGLDKPASGTVEAPAARRLLRAGDALDFTGAGLLLLDHALDARDSLARVQAATDLVQARRAGATALLLSHDEPLLLNLADEIWWLDRGRLVAKGDPREVLDRYRHHIAGRLLEWGQGRVMPLAPPLRRGDGRAELISIETLDEQGRPAMVWKSGEPAAVRVTVRYREAVQNPVVGIMIRTRIGFEVYGTNTELEGVRFGPCEPGQTLRILFSFRCELCPREYTLTAASHDPDGALHEWLEDALALAVVDSRFTAGVANLRARVTVEP